MANGGTGSKQGSIKIGIDMREQRSGVPDMIRAQANDKLGVEIEYLALPTGDYDLGDGYSGRVIVERKEAVDFVNSLIHDKRLFEQSAKMVGAADRPVMIIEGDIFNTRSRIHPNALNGALSCLALEGIFILPSKNPAQTAYLIHTLARQNQIGLGYELSFRMQKPKHLEPAQQFVVEGLPGIGASGARNLLGHFGSVAAVMQAANDNRLRECPGIGPKISEQVRDLFHQPWAGNTHKWR